DDDALLSPSRADGDSDRDQLGQDEGDESSAPTPRDPTTALGNPAIDNATPRRREPRKRTRGAHGISIVRSGRALQAVARSGAGPAGAIPRWGRLDGGAAPFGSRAPASAGATRSRGMLEGGLDGPLRWITDPSATTGARAGRPPGRAGPPCGTPSRCRTMA